MNDLQIARIGICDVLPEGERIIADRIYTDVHRFEACPTGDAIHPMERTIKVLLARHETINKRMKDYKCMRDIWRHGWRKHNLAFAALINIVQMCLLHGEPLFDIADSEI